MTNQEIEKNFRKLSETYLSLGVANEELKSSIKRLDYIEQQLSQYAENFCCIEMSDDETEQAESKCKEYLAEANELLPKLSGSIVYNTDPRGYALKVPENEADKSANAQKLSKDWGMNSIIAPSANI